MIRFLPNSIKKFEIVMFEKIMFDKEMFEKVMFKKEMFEIVMFEKEMFERSSKNLCPKKCQKHNENL